MTTATLTTWSPEAGLRLRVCLATLSRISDYRVGPEWDAEVEGSNNDLWTGAGVLPGVEQGSDEWLKAARVRSWWQFLRLDAGRTLTEAAAELDVEPSTLARWESGERTPADPVNASRAGTSHRHRYQSWLEDRRAELIESYRDEVIDLACARDGWPAPPAGVERDVLVEEFSRVGGWHDQWRRTSVLPNTSR